MTRAASMSAVAVVMFFISCPGNAQAARIAEQSFAMPLNATGPGPYDLGGGWQAYGFDPNDARTAFQPADGGGLLISRGIPWGLPGGFVTYAGDKAAAVRTIRSKMVLMAGPGCPAGRVTWLAAFAADPRAEPLLALRWDTAGQNGLATDRQGGPGTWSMRSIRSGLKLVGPLLPEDRVNLREGLDWPTSLLVPDPPPLDHVLESVLSFDPTTGRVAASVQDRTEEETIYEGHFTLQTTQALLMPKAGGYNGFADWANNKGFALRLVSISLDDSFTEIGPELQNPREGARGGRFPQRQSFPELNHFLGAVNLADPDWHRYGLGWCRHDFSWSDLEPERGLFTWRAYDRLVQEIHRNGFEILPILDYTAPWAASKKGDGFSTPQHVADWENYVERVVARYSRAPFNLRCFQVWNEPTLKAGYWHGQSNDEFFEKVYLPAAKIIRRYDCRVVFGGWPCSDSIDTFCRMLEKHQAWKWTDILDVHYFENSAWQTLYDRYVKTGKCRGIWETEIGFHPHPGYLPNCYLRALHFGLRKGWAFPDQFKIFWYAFWGAGPDGPKCLTTTGADGKILSTEHGNRLLVINEVLGGGALAAFSDYTIKPNLAPALIEETPTALGFRVGANRVVIVLLLDTATYQRHPSIVLDVRLGRTPRRVEMVNATGERSELSTTWAKGRLTMKVPMDKVPLVVARKWGREWKVATAYVVIEP